LGDKVSGGISMSGNPTQLDLSIADAASDAEFVAEAWIAYGLRRPKHPRGLILVRAAA